MNSFNLFIVLVLWVNNVESFSRREAPKMSVTNPLDMIQDNMKEILHCVDLQLAKATEQIQTNQVKPVFDILGNELQRFVKVWDVLIEPRPTQKSK